MANLQSLAAEIHVEIFCHLGSIDDVHHLAKTCKTLYRAINSDFVYRRVMGHVIRNGRQHEFDIALCHLLDLHNRIVTYIQAGGAQEGGAHETHSRDIMLNLDRFIHNILLLKSDVQLSDAHQDQILARWQGLRVLQNIWLERELVDDDYFDNSDMEAPCVRKYNTLHERTWHHESRITANESSVLENGPAGRRTLNSRQKLRFHTAVTRIWAMNELRWILTVYGSHFRVAPQHFYMLLSCYKKFFLSRRGVSILDRMEEYSVYGFLYQHLLPGHSRFLADKPCSMLPLTFPSRCVDETGYPLPQLLQEGLNIMTMCLQPPDIIDLVIRCRLTHRSPEQPDVTIPESTHDYVFPKPSYLNPNINVSTPDSRFIHQIGAFIHRHHHATERSSIALTTIFREMRQGPLPLPNRRLDHLDAIPDLLRERILTEFDMHARRDRPDLEPRFTRYWQQQIRWGVWWWAASEIKTRMKLEGLREDRV